jgi:hypothetical protein
MKTHILLIILYFFSFGLNAQTTDKVGFTATWKQNTEKAVIIVTVTNGDTPFSFIVYDGSPFNGGKIIKKTENVLTKTFEVELDKKMKVYVCLYKDETNYLAKWLEIAEQ